MPDTATLLLFATACLALTATPGPDMLLIASRSASQGRNAGFVTLAGIQVGTYLHAAAAALGLSQLFVLVPVAYDVVRWAGAAYLLYLAWTTWQATGARPAVSVTLSTELDARALRVMFRQGLITNLLNPKMVLFVLALFPQFVSTNAGSVGVQIMLLATILNAVGLIVNGGVILAASRAGSLVAVTGRMTRWPNYFLAAVFAGLAVRLAVSSRD